MNFNRYVGDVLRRFGYEVQRLGQGFHADPYEDQRAILSGRREVRHVLDGGANVGQTAGRYRALFPGATIHSFEPFPESYEALVRAYAGDDKVRAHRLALADSAGFRTFHTNSDSVTNSLLPADPGAEKILGTGMIAPRGSVEVEATTLDAFCAEHGIDALPILKMDVQGGEGLVLSGSGRMLSAGAIDVIYTEVNFAPMYEGQSDFHALCAALARYRYELYWLYDLNRGRDGLIAWGDAIFVGPALRAEMRR